MTLSRALLLIGGSVALALPLASLTPSPATSDSNPTTQLWRIEAVNTAARPVFICADATIRGGFARPLPDINGQPCTVLDPPVVKPGIFVAWCESGATRAVASSGIHGDLARDFTVSTDISLRPTDSTKATPKSDVRQTRRYRLIGGCPAGWAIGDSASAGDTQVVNAMSGAKTALAKAFAPATH
ncbi:MAG: hypothetical protein ACHP84_10550 [Caulobacterales bacterium]